MAGTGAGPADMRLKMSEVEFIAESTNVEILPNFEAAPLAFIGGDVGPFRPQRPVQVPIWLALTLRARQKCTIKPPDWLTTEFLKDKLEEEQKTEIFTEMPEHFQEIAALLFEGASTDIHEADQVRALLADVHDLRYSKMRKGLAAVKEAEAVKVNNLSMLEISSIRPFFVKSMDTFFKLEETMKVAEGSGES
eukprot:m.340057 g.340057  ORF g.340057 m.340057 type:complete len:193 (+) comp19105_c0_seq1:209-787(+)